MSDEFTVEASIRAELDAMPPAVGRSGLAASALVMARGLDSDGNSFTSKTMGQARLQDAMDRLRELAPPVEKKDGIDELAAQRAARRAAASGGARAENS